MQVQERSDLGVDVSELRIQDITTQQAKELISLTHTSKLVVIHGQSFDEAEYVAFSRKLGTPQVYLQSNYHHPDWPEIFVSSNVERNGRKFGVKATGRYWHTDYAFMPEPLPLTMVTPRIIPGSPRGTLYIDMEAVYERLPARLRAFADTHDAIHEGKWRYKIQPSDVDRALIDIIADCEKLAPAVSHPTVIEHPIRRRRALYVSSGFTTGFVGLSYEEGKRWLAELLEFVERDEHVHLKPWKEGEILLWDNRVLIHKATHGDPNEAHLSYRIGVYDGLPFYTNTAPADRPALAAQSIR